VDDVIVVEGLKKTFRTPFRRRKVEAVKGVTFRVRRGEIFGFLGPNGAGKTTTLKTLVGLIRPTAGRVEVLGGAPGDIRVMARLGFLPEQPYFYDYLKPGELLDIFGRIFGLPAAERARRIDRLLDLVGLSDARGRTLRKFSKGMLQRVGIAQALLNDPELVLLDEPMSGLDPVGRKEVLDLIASLKDQGKTVFFSSHILSDIERLCDRVVILHKGEVRHQGTLDELLAQGDRREILVAGPLDAAWAAREGVQRVERVGPTVTRVMVDAAASDATLRALLDARLEVLQVTDRRISLEELFVQTAGSGPVGAREVPA
jgi:ABC-2 type transport system ATP-binding protein